MKDAFEKGLFWELYVDLERQFLAYLDYVPYLKGNERTYSFKLLNLALSIGGYIDSFFKEMVRYGEFTDEDCIEKCNEIKELMSAGKSIDIYMPINAFEKEYSFSKTKVVFKCLPQRKGMTPFALRPNGNNIPTWWSFYNDLKHDLSVNLKKANLKNTRDALAGAFILNAVHKPSIFRLHKYGLLKMRYGVLLNDNQLKDQLTNNQTPPGLIETNLFIYDYEENPKFK